MSVPRAPDRVDFSFARPLAPPEDRAAPPPRKTQTSLALRGRVGPACGGTSTVRPPAGPAAGCAQVRLGAGVEAPVNLVGWGSGPKGLGGVFIQECTVEL